MILIKELPGIISFSQKLDGGDSIEYEMTIMVIGS